jgi:hypothetical protein
MSDVFVEPKSLDEATNRLRVVQDSTIRTQSQLAELNIEKRAKFVPDYEQRKRKLKLAHDYASAENRFLRSWIKKYNIESRLRTINRKDGKVDEARVPSLASNVMDAVYTLSDFTDNVVHRLSQVLQENEQLRQRLAKYEPVEAVAPGNEVDFWRDGYKKTDEGVTQ